MNVYVYVLKLGNNCWYIGSTRNPKQRLKTHKTLGKANKWVKEHGIVGNNYHSIEEVLDPQDLLKEEFWKTVKYMAEYGHTKVRGSVWVVESLVENHAELITKYLIPEVNNACWKCGEPGHKQDRCPSRKKGVFKRMCHYSKQSISNASKCLCDTFLKFGNLAKIDVTDLTQQLRTQVNQMTCELYEKSQVVDNLCEKVCQMQQEIDDSKTEISTLRNETELLQGKIDELQSENCQLQIQNTNNLKKLGKLDKLYQQEKQQRESLDLEHQQSIQQMEIYKTATALLSLRCS